MVWCWWFIIVGGLVVWLLEFVGFLGDGLVCVFAGLL